MVSVAFNTYPMAFDTIGGGEIQILAYKRFLPLFKVNPVLFNLWEPCLEQVDLVHFFSVIGGSYEFCHYISKIKKIPLFVSSSLWITEETKHLYPVEEIKNILNCADVIVTNSEMETEALSSVLKLPKDKFIAVYNGIDTEYTQGVDPNLFIRQASEIGPYVLCVGNIEERKNQLALVRAMKHFPEYALLLIGRARDPEYARQCLAEGGKQVFFHGLIPHESPLLRSAMSGAALTSMPGLLETPSLAALEAAALGSRLVITEVGSTREYFGSLADYVNPHDPESIRRGLESALGRTPDERLSRHVIARFTWDKTLPKLAEAYFSYARGRR